MSLLQAVHREELDREEIERIVKTESDLCYKLLRFINSARFGFHYRVHSIRHALLLLGEREIKRWISLVALSSAAAGKPPELMATALRRAAFCELLGPATGEPANDLFLIGLLSVLDAILDRPREEVFAEIAVHEDIRLALLGWQTRLSNVLKLVECYDRGLWNEVAMFCESLQIAEHILPEKYSQAIAFARQVTELDV